MTKVTITRVFKGLKTTKYGDKPSVGIKTAEHGDKWLSTFKVTPEMDKWAEGDVVEVNVTENKGYLNFDTGAPSPVAGLEARVHALEVHAGLVNQPQERVIQMDNDGVKPTDKDDFDF